MNEKSSSTDIRSRSDRIVGSILGILFVVLAIVMLVSSNQSNLIGSLLAVFVVGGIGIDALINATRNKRSLLSRIGPLP